MTTHQSGTVLTPEERLARRRLIVRDAISLLSLFFITAIIFTLTWMLFRSFQNHEQDLGVRWRARGERSLRDGHPAEAVPALRTALAYLPDRKTEIELATALAGSGKTVEATAYFNTLLESAPGDGRINLQLARLAARAGNVQLAILRYQAALDGTWQGNGYQHRREVRLELAGYLLSRKLFSQARTQLLVADSNAPEDDPVVRVQIAGMLVQAGDLQSALEIYRTLSNHRNPPYPALAGAGRTAYALGMFRAAANYLNRAFASPNAAKQPAPDQASDRTLLANANRILVLYPDINLPARARAERILAAKKIAYRRLAACSAPPAAAPPPAKGVSLKKNPATNSEAPVQAAVNTALSAAISALPPQIAALQARWKQLPARLTVRALAQQPDLEQSIMQLVYDTETTTAQVCGAPTGDNALLLAIARNPGAVEQP